MPATIAAVPPDERVAIIRGLRDDYAKFDSALLAAGGNRIQRYAIPFSGHSLKGLAMASFEVRRALDWILADWRGVRRAHHRAGAGGNYDTAVTNETA